MSKILESGPPERCPFWIEARAVTPRLSSNLLRFAKLTLLSGHRHFCANLLNLSKFRSCVKPRIYWNQACNISSSAGSFTCLFDRHSGEVSQPQKGRTAQNIKERPASKCLAPPRRTKGFFLSGHAMGLFSAGFPTGAGRALRSQSALRTGFPLPTRGRPHRPPGGSTATSATFQE